MNKNNLGKYFILIGIDFLIYGFQTKKSAQEFIKENEELLKKMYNDKEDMTIENKDSVESIVLDIFWDQPAGNGEYRPQWIEKGKDLKEYCRK